jgi:uncharacterized protein (TIGR02646 family)
MIHVKRGSAPPIFQSKEFQLEKKRTVDFFSKQSTPDRLQDHFDFKFFKHPEVRKALEDLFHSKCAFCETNYSAVSPMDVENFRPKGGAIGIDGKLSPLHYWWLAYEWFNLYPACAECNRSKGSRFPVNGPRAAVQATETEVRKEKALLMDPCVDHPEFDFIFEPGGQVASNSLRGRKTIDTYNLNRSALVTKRGNHGRQLKAQWDRVTYLTKQKKVRETELKSEFKILREFLAPQREFVAMSQSCLQQWAIEFCKLYPKFSAIFDPLIMLRTGFTPQAETEARRSSLQPLLKRPTSKRAKSPTTVKRRISKTVKDFQAHEASQASYSLAKTSEREKFFAKTQYIESIEIKNFKVIQHLKLSFGETLDAGSWLLILGENGTGKSSVLNAVAIALMGERERKRLGLNDGRRLATYPRKKGDVVKGFVKVQLTGGGDAIRIDFRSDSRRIVTNTPDPKVLLLGYSATRLLPLAGSQLTTGSQFSKTDNLFNPFLALTRSSHWLHELKTKAFDDVVASLKRLMLLKPRDRFLKAAKGRIQVKAFGGATVYLEDLSAGYQSVLAVSTDIMSVLLHLWGSVRVAEGIVLIDEIDAHLHPRWKMQIVERLRETFPRVQFLVTSHEPLTLRGLNQQEVAVMLRSPRGQVTAITEDLPNPKALRVDQLLTSEFFGLSCTLSPELEIEFNEYYALLAMRKRSEKQETRMNELKAKFDGLRLMGDTPRERMMYEVIDQFLAQKEKRAPDIEELETETRETLLQMWQEV